MLVERATKGEVLISEEELIIYNKVKKKYIYRKILKKTIKVFCVWWCTSRCVCGFDKTLKKGKIRHNEEYSKQKYSDVSRMVRFNAIRNPNRSEA